MWFEGRKTPATCCTNTGKTRINPFQPNTTKTALHIDENVQIETKKSYFSSSLPTLQHLLLSLSGPPQILLALLTATGAGHIPSPLPQFSAVPSAEPHPSSWTASGDRVFDRGTPSLLKANQDSIKSQTSLNLFFGTQPACCFLCFIL